MSAGSWGFVWTGVRRRGREQEYDSEGSFVLSDWDEGDDVKEGDWRKALQSITRYDPNKYGLHPLCSASFRCSACLRPPYNAGVSLVQALMLEKGGASCEIFSNVAPRVVGQLHLRMEDRPFLISPSV